MEQKIIGKIKEKLPAIVMAVILIYLMALAVKTGHVVYTEILNPKPPAYEVKQ